MTADLRRRYLAFAWPEGDHRAGRQARVWGEALIALPGWIRAEAAPGFEVWRRAAARLPVRRLGPGGPLILGDYFAAAKARLPVSGPARATARALLWGGWGAYVALFRGPDGALEVLCDPSGALPAHAFSLHGVQAVTDDVEGLPPAFAPAAAALDWDAIAGLLTRPYQALHLSPLAGVRAVSPGELHAVGAGRSEQLWRPSAFAAGPEAGDGAALRVAVLTAADRLAGVEAKVLTEVSGGLDSAIVAGALAATGHAHRIAAAVNSHAPTGEGDERPWARAVAERHGLPLLCAPMAARPLAIADYEAFAGHIGPAYGALDAPRDAVLARLARRTGVSALFGGQGGDAVFFQMPSAAVVADYLLAHGPTGAFHPFPRQVARRLRRSIWSVLGEVRAGAGRVGRPAAASQKFWGPRARETRVRPHPWLADLDAVPPGKAVQITALLGTHEHWGRSRRAWAAAVVQPLLAQPVVEAALAIPTWRLVAGGQDRALARRVFADLLPPAVAARRSKGMVAALYAQRMAASLEAVRPYLLDGALVDAGLLDRQAVEAALQPQALLWTGEGARLTRALMLEAWVRHWQARVPDLASAPRRR